MNLSQTDRILIYNYQKEILNLNKKLNTLNEQ